MKTCAYCGSEVEDGALTCPHCAATKFTRTCPQCGTVYDGLHCPTCKERANAAWEEAQARQAEEEAQHAEFEAEWKANSGLAWKTVLTVFLPFAGGFFLIRKHVKPGFRIFAIIWCAVVALEVGLVSDALTGTKVLASLMCLAPIAVYLLQSRENLVAKDSEGLKAKLLLAAFVVVLVVSLVLDVAGSGAL